MEVGSGYTFLPTLWCGFNSCFFILMMACGFAAAFLRRLWLRQQPCGSLRRPRRDRGLRVPPTPSLDSLLTPLYRRRSAGGWRPRSAAFWRGALPLLQMLYPRFPTVQSGISESPLRHPRKSPDRPTHAVHATPDGKCSLFPQPAAPAPRSSLGQTRRMPKRAEEPSPPPACLCTLCAFHVQRQPTASSSSIHSSPPSSPPPSSPPSTGGSGSGTYCELYHSSVCTLQRPIDDMSASAVTPVK